MGSLRQIPTVGNKHIDVQKFFVQCLIILQLVSYSILGGKEDQESIPILGSSLSHSDQVLDNLIRNEYLWFKQHSKR